MSDSIPLAVIRDRLAEAELKRSLIVAEIKLLTELIDAADTPPVRRRTITVNGMRDTFHVSPDIEIKDLELKPRPTDAITKLVREEPGLTSTEITDMLEGVVHSSAKDVRNVLRTTIAKLAADNEIFRDPDGRLYPSAMAAAGGVILERKAVSNK